MSRVPFPLAFISAACLACGPAAAIGIGNVRTPVVFGQTLDISVPVQLAADETLEAGCVEVEVHVGDVRLGAEQLATSVLPARGGDTARVRIRSRSAVDEPVVSLTVAAGCPVRIKRNFVLFADPPEFIARAAEMPGYVHAVSPPALPAAEPLAASQELPLPVAGPVAAAAAAHAPAAAVPAAAPRRVAREPVARASQPAKAGPAAAEAAPAPAARTTARPKRAEPPPAVAARSAPRLQLEMLEPLPPVEDPRAVAAREAAQAAQAAASAAMAQVAANEAELSRLRSVATSDREVLAALEARIAAAERRAEWMQGLLAVLFGISLTLGGLLWRDWRRRRADQQAWWTAAAAAAAAPGPVAPPQLQAAAAAPARAGEDDEPLPATVAPSVERRVPLWMNVRPGGAEAAGPSAVDATSVAVPQDEPSSAEGHPPLPERNASPHEWTLDEDADIEQRADFFVVLGLDDDAIGVLRSHLARTGSQSPVAFLKLLEIHRRRGSREAYERTAREFAGRFNVRPPAWDAHGRDDAGLEAHPQLLGEVERHWADPREAMDSLESMLWRRPQGDAALSLAAFEDAMLLYQVARRRLGLEGGGAPLSSATTRTAVDPGDGDPVAVEAPWVAAAPATVEHFTIDFDLDAPTGAQRTPLEVR